MELLKLHLWVIVLDKKKKHEIVEQKLKDAENKRFQEFVRKKCNIEERNRKDHYHHGLWKKMLPYNHH